MTQRSLIQTLCAGLLTVMGLLASSASWAQVCTREYMPVCGKAANEPEPRTYPNRCVLAAAGANLLSTGPCATQSHMSPQAPLITGGDLDAHGCKASAGYIWHEELASCIRPWLSSAITLEVAPHRRRCTGLFETECLLVREVVPGQPETKWMPLFNGIAGFNPSPGVRYTLRVRKERAEKPPMDAPDTTYTLLRVIP